MNTGRNVIMNNNGTDIKNNENGGCATLIGSFFVGWLVICISNLFDSVIGYIIGICVIVYGFYDLNLKKSNKSKAIEQINKGNELATASGIRKGGIELDSKKWMFIKSSKMAREFNPYNFALNREKKIADIEVRSVNTTDFIDEDFVCKDVWQYFRYRIYLDKNRVVRKQHCLYKKNTEGKWVKVNYYGEFFDEQFNVNDDEFFKILANSFRHLLNDEFTPVYACDKSKWVVLGQYKDSGKDADTISVDPNFMKITNNTNFTFIAKEEYTNRFYDCKGYEYIYYSDGNGEWLALQAITYFIQGKPIFVVRKGDDSIYLGYPDVLVDLDKNNLQWVFDRLKERKNKAVKYLPASRKTIIPEDFNINVTDENIIKRRFEPIIGLQPVKDMILERIKVVLLEKQRKKKGIATSIGTSKHMIFTGNPGTGKTTVARLVADIFADTGITSKTVCIETDREQLVAGYKGQTATKTKEVFNKAVGGVLFIDEAYSLARDAKDEFGQEALDTLVKLMDDHKNDTVVILAGYTKEMNSLLSMNPGLKSRFPTIIEFPDYSDEELAEICCVLLKKKELTFSPGVEKKILFEIGRKKRFSGADSGNGRLASNFVDEIISNQASRLANSTSNSANVSKKMLSEIKIEDIPEATFRKEGYDLETDLNKVIGMDSVKQVLRELDSSVRMQQLRASMGMKTSASFTNHFIFAGNPGTGKTTMARMVGRILNNLGVIPSTNMVEVSRKDLVGEYVGQTAPKTTEVFKRATGGVLFIDEAYLLARDSKVDFGSEAIGTLLKLMEDDRNTVVILAGYDNEMKQLLQLNSGLASRFPDWIHFPDYSADELVEIAKIQYAKENYEMSVEAKQKFKEIMQLRKEKAQSENGHFDNARGVRNYVEKSIKRQNVRIDSKVKTEGIKSLTEKDMILILPEDLSIDN